MPNNYDQYKYYKGEAKCPQHLDNYLKRGWWTFEKGYSLSVMADKIPFYDYFKFNKDLSQYKYYKGEEECPYNYDDGIEANRLKNKWWNFEKEHWDKRGNGGTWSLPFAEFFMIWIFDHAAPNSWVDLNNGNWWVEEYVRYAPLNN